MPQTVVLVQRTQQLSMNNSKETMVAQRGGKYPTPENIPVQVEQGFKQPDLVEYVPAYCQGLN